MLSILIVNVYSVRYNVIASVKATTRNLFGRVCVRYGLTLFLLSFAASRYKTVLDWHNMSDGTPGDRVSSFKKDLFCCDPSRFISCALCVVHNFTPFSVLYLENKLISSISKCRGFLIRVVNVFLISSALD